MKTTPEFSALKARLTEEIRVEALKVAVALAQIAQKEGARPSATIRQPGGRRKRSDQDSFTGT